MTSARLAVPLLKTLDLLLSQGGLDTLPGPHVGKTLLPSPCHFPTTQLDFVLPPTLCCCQPCRLLDGAEWRIMFLPVLAPVVACCCQGYEHMC